MKGLMLVALGVAPVIVRAGVASTELEWGSENCEYRSCYYKAPNPKTSRAIAQQWHEEDEALWKYVGEQVPEVLDHTGSAAFDEHLKGVQAVLRYWGAPKHLSNAGLFHSIYGTEGFQGFSLPLTQREAVRSLIGEQAEQLAFVFCMIDRSSFDETVFAWSESVVEESSTFKVKARPELGRFEMELDKEEWLDFVELTLADWLEQVEGAASKENEAYYWKLGEAFSYRRLAYRKMAQILATERAPRLSEIPFKMYEDVMGTEGRESRSLVQMRTPPMSKAAAEALSALRAHGESIPQDLSPKPIEECSGVAPHF